MGRDAKDVIDNKETSIILSIRIFLLIISEIFFFILKRVTTSKA